MKNRQPITEVDLQNAINKFVREGGLIKYLPDEIVPANMMVGQKWGMYESVLDTNVGSADSGA